MTPRTTSLAAFVLVTGLARAALAQGSPPPLPAQDAAAPNVDASDSPVPVPVPVPVPAPEAKAPAGAGAAAAAPAPESDDLRPPGPPSARGLRGALGLKLAYVGSSGFDTFATNDALPQFSIEVVDAFFTRGRLALGGGLAFEVGGRSSDLRNLDASFGATRFAVPLEARWAVSRALWAVARVAPGATRGHVTVKDPSAPASLEDSAWAFSVDASVGPAFVLGSETAKRAPRFVVLPEVGYTFATPLAFGPKPTREEDDVVGGEGALRVPDVSLSGFFWRATVGLVF